MFPAAGLHGCKAVRPSSRALVRPGALRAVRRRSVPLPDCAPVKPYAGQNIRLLRRSAAKTFGCKDVRLLRRSAVKTFGC